MAAAACVLSACGDATPRAASAAQADTAAPDAPPPVTIPRSELRQITSTTLGRTYDLQIKLPPSYSRPDSAGRRYPVVYLNDAPYNFQVAAGITHFPMNAGAIEDLILVGIGYDHASTGDESRIRDYTPTRNPEFERETGGASDYLRFVKAEVIPMVEATYRADPEQRTLAGHSFGGLFGAYALFAEPGLFHNYILSSPSFWFHRDVMFDLERDYAASHKALPGNVYIGIGSLEHPHRPHGSEHEMVEGVRMFERVLHSRKYPDLNIRTGVIDGATHETAFPAVLMNGLLWHFASQRDIPYGY